MRSMKIRTHDSYARVVAVTAALCCCGHGHAQALTPQEMGMWLASEKEKCARVVKESGYKAA